MSVGRNRTDFLSIKMFELCLPLDAALIFLQRIRSRTQAAATPYRVLALMSVAPVLRRQVSNIDRGCSELRSAVESASHSQPSSSDGES